MPSRTPRSKSSLPAIFAGLGSLPKREITGRVLVVLVHIDARPVRDTGEVLLRELAVRRKFRNAEIPRTILGFIGNVLLGQPLDQRNHLLDVLGSACDDLRVLNRQRIQVLEKCLLIARGVFANGNAGSRCVADDLVVHIGNVHNVADLYAKQLQRASQDIDMQKGAEVADMAVVVDRGAAGINAERLAVGGLQFFNGVGKSVVEANGHSCGFPCDSTSCIHLPSASEGSAESSAGAYWPSISFGHAAAATIAALSVESASDGNAIGRLCSAASAVKRTRSSRLAATPPEMRMLAASKASAA